MKEARIKFNLLGDCKERVIEPEVEDNEERTLPEKGFVRIITKKIQSGRQEVEKRIAATALRFGIDPQPLIKGLWEVLLLLPRLVLLVMKLSWDKRVPVRMRLLCVSGLVYIILPLDFIPEGVLGVVGVLDDLAIALVILDILVNNIEPEIIREHWDGDEDVLRIIKESVSLAKWFLPPQTEAIIRRFFKLGEKQ